MSVLRIVSDATARGLASEFAALLAAAGHSTQVAELTTYPVADSLPALLHRSVTGCDAAVVAVDLQSHNRSWVLRELAMAELYPRIFVGLASGRDQPDWWRPDDLRILALDRPLPPGLASPASRR